MGCKACHDEPDCRPQKDDLRASSGCTSANLNSPFPGMPAIQLCSPSAGSDICVLSLAVLLTALQDFC